MYSTHTSYDSCYPTRAYSVISYQSLLIERSNGVWKPSSSTGKRKELSLKFHRPRPDSVNNQQMVLGVQKTPFARTTHNMLSNSRSSLLRVKEIQVTHIHILLFIFSSYNLSQVVTPEFQAQSCMCKTSKINSGGQLYQASQNSSEAQKFLVQGNRWQCKYSPL